DALMLLGLLPEGEAAGAGPVPRSPWQQLFDALLSARRATRIHVAGQTFWVAAEQLPMAAIIHPGHRPEPDIAIPARHAARNLARAEAIRELLRGRLQATGPVTAPQLAAALALTVEDIDLALLALESEGFVMRGQFT